jgi:phosphotransferase system HPr-like phosphotransfer protein
MRALLTRPLSSESKCLARVTLVGLLLIAQCAVANEVRIAVIDCTSKVHLVARQAPLSAIFKQLAKTLAFELKYESAVDPIIDIDSTMRLVDLVTKLGQPVNLSIVENRDAHCSNVWRVSRVDVLPGPDERLATQALGQPQTLSLGTPEQARRAQEEVETFLAETHGGPPPSVTSKR